MERQLSSASVDTHLLPGHWPSGWEARVNAELIEATLLGRDGVGPAAKARSTEGQRDELRG